MVAAICKEMWNVKFAFEECEDVQIGYEQTSMCMIFDVKLGRIYCQKARTTDDSHKTEPQILRCMIVALNRLDVLSCNIQNAYLTAPYRKKYWILASP